MCFMVASENGLSSNTTTGNKLMKPNDLVDLHPGMRESLCPQTHTHTHTHTHPPTMMSGPLLGGSTTNITVPLHSPQWARTQWDVVTLSHDPNQIKHGTLPLHFYPAPFYVISPLERHIMGLKASHIVVVLRFIHLLSLPAQNTMYYHVMNHSENPMNG